VNQTITDQDDFPGGTHGQSARVSLQQLEDMPSTHPFEHYPPDRRAEVPEFVEFQWIPEMGIAPSSKKRGSKQWKCLHDGCNKSYGRRQETLRHMRDKHEISRKCESLLYPTPSIANFLKSRANRLAEGPDSKERTSIHDDGRCDLGNRETGLG
jgi:hypothetical protein